MTSNGNVGGATYRLASASRSRSRVFQLTMATERQTVFALSRDGAFRVSFLAVSVGRCVVFRLSDGEIVV
jgi:hypothetical protein